MIYCFHPDGSHTEIAQQDGSTKCILIPQSNQYVVKTSLLSMLPSGIRNLVDKWPWLVEKLNPSQIAIVDADTGNILWTLPFIEHFRPGLFNRHTYEVNRDGKLLFVPISAEKEQVLYEAYALPLSLWLPAWPPLAALATMLLILSQGFRRLRICTFRCFR